MEVASVDVPFTVRLELKVAAPFAVNTVSVVEARLDVPLTVNWVMVVVARVLVALTLNWPIKVSLPESSALPTTVSEFVGLDVPMPILP